MSKKDFITEEHIKRRETFRTVGPLVLGVGILLLIIAMVDFFTVDPFDFEGPKYFELAFIGMPLIAVGAFLCSLGYGAAVAKYQSREMAPVIKDTLNYLAEETQEGVEAIARAAQKGKSTVIEAKQCSNCNELNKLDAKYCNECGKPL